MPTGDVECHRKLHAFEHGAISSGAEYTVFDTSLGCRISVLIGYDCNIIENVRITALMGAEILLAPHQTGGCRTRNPHLMGAIDRAIWDNPQIDPQRIEQEILSDKGRGWLMRWLPSRAHDSGMFVVFSNGVGIDDGEIRAGNAMILDPYGRIIVESRKADDDMVVARLDGSLLEQSTGRGWMQARRPDLYSSLTVRTGREGDAPHLKFEDIDELRSRRLLAPSGGRSNFRFELKSVIGRPALVDHDRARRSISSSIAVTTVTASASATNGRDTANIARATSAASPAATSRATAAWLPSRARARW